MIELLYIYVVLVLKRDNIYCIIDIVYEISVLIKNNE